MPGMMTMFRIGEMISSYSEKGIPFTGPLGSFLYLESDAQQHAYDIVCDGFTVSTDYDDFRDLTVEQAIRLLERYIAMGFAIVANREATSDGKAIGDAGTANSPW